MTLSALGRFPAVESQRNKIFLCNERCIPPNRKLSNYGMVREALFANDIPKVCKVKRMEGKLSNREVAAKNYERMLWTL